MGVRFFSRLALRLAIASTAAAVTVGVGCGLDVNGEAEFGPDAAPGSDATADRSIDTGWDTTADHDSSLPDVQDASDSADAGDAYDVTDALDAADALDAHDAADACDAAVEDCLNGVDDNCDGKIDCADPQCAAGFECVPTSPPNGWTGYSLYLDTQGACPSGFGSVMPEYDNLGFQPVACNACSCAASGTTCAGVGTIDCSALSTCTQPPNQTEAVFTDGGCTDFAVAMPITASSYCAVVDDAVLGSCAAGGGGVGNRPTPHFATAAQACDLDKAGAGCGAGKECVAKPSNVQHGLCVWRSIGDAGVAACPGGYDGGVSRTPSDTAGSFLDTRDCTACACGALADAGCTATANVFDVPACGGDAGLDASAVLNGTCTQNLVVVATSLQSAQVTAAPAQGGCPADGGAPMGTVTATDLKQYCCQH